MKVRSVPPTRSGLVRANAQLGRVQKGRELLNRKREALITELFKSARPALNARQEVEERASEAYRALLRALAARGQASLETYAWPERQIRVELEHKQLWGISVPSVVSHSPVQRTLTARETAAPSVGPAAAQTATEFERLVELVLEALPKRAARPTPRRRARQGHSTGQHATASRGADVDRRAQCLEAHARGTGARRAIETPPRASPAEEDALTLSSRDGVADTKRRTQAQPGQNPCRRRMRSRRRQLQPLELSPGSVPPSGASFAGRNHT